MIPVYKKIADDIINDIVGKKYSTNNKLPTEDAFISHYDVSRTTIRKALNVVITKGYVYPVQGSGIFVRDAALKNYFSLENLRGFTKDWPNSDISAEILEFKIIYSDEKLSHNMKCDVGNSIYFVNRLRKKDGEIFSIEYSYYNKDIIHYLNEDIIKGSIYNYITNDLKLNIGFADKVIYSDKLTDVDAKNLLLNENDPALIIENTVFLTNGSIFEISKVVHNYKNTKLLKLANF